MENECEDCGLYNLQDGITYEGLFYCIDCWNKLHKEKDNIIKVLLTKSEISTILIYLECNYGDDGTASKEEIKELKMIIKKLNKMSKGVI